MTTSSLSIPRAGFALGGSLAVLYTGCVFLMMTAPRDAVVRFANSVLHGLDIESIMRWEMPVWEACIGVIEIFIIGWFLGALFASLYNFGSK